MKADAEEEEPLKDFKADGCFLSLAKTLDVRKLLCLFSNTFSFMRKHNDYQ